MKTITFFLATAMFSGVYVGAMAQPQPGKLIWSYDAGTPIPASPAVAKDGTVYIGGQGGLMAVTNNASSGSNKWTFYPGESLQGAPTVGSDGTIYFGGGNANFYAVNPDGSQRWVLPLQPEYTNQVVYRSTPAVGLDNTLYFVASGRLYAVSSNGSNKWEHTIDTASTPNFPLSPAIGADGTIYVGSFYQGSFYAIRPDGSEKWSFAFNSPTSESPAIDADQNVYVTAGGLHSFSPDGTHILSGGGTSLGLASAILGRNGMIYVADTSLALTAIQADGQTIWRTAQYAAPLLPTTPAIDAAGTLYYCVSNTLFAVSPAGAVLWVFHSPYAPAGNHVYDSQASPVISPGGTIYAVFGTQLFALVGTNTLGDTAWPMYRQNVRHTGKVERPSLKPPQKRGDANIGLELYAQVGDPFTIQASTNLNTWTSLTSFVATTVPIDLVDWTATNFPVRFYRASSP